VKIEGNYILVRKQKWKLRIRGNLLFLLIEQIKYLKE
jgi:hypothetical protein